MIPLQPASAAYDLRSVTPAFTPLPNSTRTSVPINSPNQTECIEDPSRSHCPPLRPGDNARFSRFAELKHSALFAPHPPSPLRIESVAESISTVCPALPRPLQSPSAHRSE